MKKLLTLFFALFCFSVVNAQESVTWVYNSVKTGDNEFELTFKANIAAGYYMYSMDKTDGPLPLEFNFDESADYQLIDAVTADKDSKEKFDEGFEINVKYYEGTVTFKQKAKLLTEKVAIKGIINYQSCSPEQCIPGDSEFSFSLEGATVAKAPTAKKEGDSLVGFFILAFFMGLLGVITPCVFPMIPMTVSFFMSGTSKKSVIVTKGLIFGLSVTLIYTLIGVIVALTQNESFATILSSHWIPNALFFILFIVFALSFFGAFEITLPNSIATKADQQVDKGGYLASFFLAITLAVISFSCTGPFVGTLLVESATGGVALKPILGMFGFGLGLGLPFVVFAFLPSLMRKLPKSGGWLNAVKVVFAFVLLAMSIKFFDIVDNYFGWGIITRDVAIAIWIVLAIFMGLYLLGKIRLSHDTEVKSVSIFRLLLSIAVFTFAVYLAPGLFGAPLSAVSGFLPAEEKQVFTLVNDAQPQYIIQGNGSNNQTISSATMNIDNLCGTPKYSNFLSLPKGISGYFDLKEGLACAKEQNKPVLLDFKGHNCSNCKKMEKGIFLDQRIIDMLNDKFIVIGLYTDDKTELPAEEHITTATGRVLKTIGDVNKNYESTTYQLIAQPYFVITTPDGTAISEGVGYETNADRFIEWLQKGLDAYNK